MEEEKNRGQLVQKFWRNAKGMVVVVSNIGLWLEKKCTMSGNDKGSKISRYFIQENPYLLGL